MKATAFEFRFRFIIHALIYTVGFIAPWNHLLHLDTISTWQFLAAWLFRYAHLGFSAATVTVLALGIVVAIVAAALRTWGAAYIGAAVVQDASMHGHHIVAAGPYRHLRNPLYLGTFIHTFALALLMPPTGAIFTILAIGFFQIRLIAAEEVFLADKLGDPYRAYCAQVPSIVPALTPRVAASPTPPVWLHAILGEIYMWGVAAAFIIAGSRYNARLVVQGIIIALGVSLIVRAFIPKR
jgi:protein-S-isoprenylcysteine O-methyltransferase Ste14